MLTRNAVELSVVKVTTLQPGDLFVYVGSGGRFTAVVVENEEGHYFSWMRLTGDHSFFMEDLGQGTRAYSHAPKVLNVSLRWDKLQVQIDPASVSLAADALVGSLIIEDDVQIATAFKTRDDDDLDERFGVLVRNLDRQSMSASSAYMCAKWQLIYVPPELPPEVVAEFSPTRSATAEPLRI